VRGERMKTGESHLSRWLLTGAGAVVTGFKTNWYTPKLVYVDV